MVIDELMVTDVANRHYLTHMPYTNSEMNGPDNGVFRKLPQGTITVATNLKLLLALTTIRQIAGLIQVTTRVGLVTSGKDW